MHLQTIIVLEQLVKEQTKTEDSERSHFWCDCHENSQGCRENYIGLSIPTCSLPRCSMRTINWTILYDDNNFMTWDLRKCEIKAVQGCARVLISHGRWGDWWSALTDGFHFTSGSCTCYKRFPLIELFFSVMPRLFWVWCPGTRQFKRQWNALNWCWWRTYLQDRCMLRLTSINRFHVALCET